MSSPELALKSLKSWISDDHTDIADIDRVLWTLRMFTYEHRPDFAEHSGPTSKPITQRKRRTQLAHARKEAKKRLQEIQAEQDVREALVELVQAS